MCNHLVRNYRIISVMFWSFPYLLWQAFGNWSGFVVGVLVAVALTAMFNDLFHRGIWHTASSAERRSFQAEEAQPRRQEAEPYQCGYRAKIEPYRAQTQPTPAGELQPQYEEMQVPYPPVAMPPMEQK